MKYNVHMYVGVRVKVTGIEAESPEEAALAAGAVDLQSLLRNTSPHQDDGLPGGVAIEHVEYAEGGIDSAVVDPIGMDGQPDIDNSVDLTGEDIYDHERAKARS